MDAVLLASPEHYRISYAINPLTSSSSVADSEKAMGQFEKVKDRICSKGIPVHVVSMKQLNSDGKFPDAVFVSNSALLVRGWPTKLAILSRYANDERKGEEQYIESYLQDVLGYKVVRLPEKEGLYFEGQGDSRWSHDGAHLWIQYGAGRTTLAGIEAVRSILLKEAALANWIPPTVHALQNANKKTYHLDLCFLPLPNGRLLLHNSSFSLASRKELAKWFKKESIISVPQKYMYACNSVWLNESTLLIPKLEIGCRSWIYKASGMRVEEVNVSEFHLAGGSVSCMVLPVWKTV